MDSEYKIVVARYNENIDWINDDNIQVYNKGTQLDNSIPLENVGREAHTYLHYIITNYGNLPDVVVFTQGSIAEHNGESKTDDINYLLNLKDEALIHGKTIPKPGWVCNSVSKNSNCFDPEWNKDPNGNWYLSNNYKDNQHILFIDWFKRHINCEYPNPIIVYWAAIFAVRRDYILKNSVEYYKKLLLECNHHSEPIEAHFLERSWYYIFGDNQR